MVEAIIRVLGGIILAAFALTILSVVLTGGLLTWCVVGAVNGWNPDYTLLVILVGIAIVFFM